GRYVALEERANHVIADPKRLREEQTTEAYHQAADGWPPHPVDWQQPKGILSGVDRHGQNGREHASQQAHQHATEKTSRANKHGVQRAWKEWSQANDIAPRCCRARA